VKYTDKERDTSIERMLAKTLRAQTSARPKGDCLDAETIAAWADDALPARERAAARAHVADCERCQALLAAAIKTMPASVARSPWRLPFMGWLVPLAVAAAAIAIWINVNPRRSTPSRAQATAPNVAAVSPRQEVSSPPATAQPSTPPAPAPPPATARNKTTARGFTDALAKREPAPLVTTSPAAPMESRAAAESAPAPASLPAPPPASPAQPTVAENATVGGVGGIAGQRDAASKPQAGNASKTLDTIAPQAMMQGFAAREASTIVSPDSGHRWRVLDSRGSVQHSSDGGASWETQLMGASVSAGSSPSSSICWLVGRGGVVLLSTDGRTWTRIQFPEPIDLTSIRATDDRSATVTTRDGRTFSTSDRGVTWTLQ